MECRKFDLTLISAKDLEDVRMMFRMKVHARVSIRGGGGPDDQEERRTPPDTHGGTNPAWTFTMGYTIHESMVQHYNTMLVIKLYCTRMLGDRYVGEIRTPMRVLFDRAYADGGSAVLDFPVQKGCDNSKGILSLSYRFGGKFMADPETVAGWTRSY